MKRLYLKRILWLLLACACLSLPLARSASAATADSRSPHAVSVMYASSSYSPTHLYPTGFDYDYTINDRYRFQLTLDIRDQSTRRDESHVEDGVTTMDMNYRIHNAALYFGAVLFHTTPISHHLTLLTGAGMYFSPSRNENGTDYLDDFEHNWIDQSFWGAGLTGRVGMEWGLNDALSILGKTGAGLNYYRIVQTVQRSDPLEGLTVYRTTYNRLSFSTYSVQIGMRYRF